MKKQLILFVMLLLPMVASADAVEINGIFYTLLIAQNNSHVAEVTSNPNGYEGSVVIPKKVTYEGIEYSVTSIESNAFSSCNVTSVTIPNSVTSIGDGAFQYCSIISSIEVESGNTVYDSRGGCNAIIQTSNNTLIVGCMNTVIPNSVTSIGNNAFAGCCNFTSVTIPNSVTSIGNEAFADCWNLTSLTIPNSVTSIGDHAFYRCWNLTSVTIPNSMTSIGNGAFSNCDGLTSIMVESGNTVYDSRGGCNAIIQTNNNTLIAGCMNTTIPNSVTSIGYEAFAGYRFTSVTIPNSVTSIGYGAFSGCRFTSVTIPNSVTSIGDKAFLCCFDLTSLTIPNSVTSIGYGAFHQCMGLTSVTIPNSVTSIGHEAFSYCLRLTSVSIGSGVRNIDKKVFAVCKSLKDVYCYAENVPSTNADAFENSLIERATLHVPNASLAAYSNSEPWSQFGTKVGLTDEEMTGVKDLNVNDNLNDKGKVVYDLSGKRFNDNGSSALRKGMYIVNGRKVLVK